MAELQDISFGGLAARGTANRIRFSEALKADDCFLDTDSVVGRNGTRNVIAAPSYVASSGLSQHMGRFRPSNTSARTVAVIDGEVFIVTDPSSELLSDGVATSLGTPFGATARISGAQLGTSYYLFTDESGVAARRINWTSPTTYAIESLEAIPAPDKPTGSVNNTLTWNAFSVLTPSYTGTIIVQTSSSTGFTNMDSAWRGFSATNNGNDDPAAGTAVTYDITTPFDATGYDWLAVTITPHDEGGSAGNRRVTIQVSDDNTNFYNVGSIYDVPPTAGSPNLIFCDLRNILSTVRDGLRYFKFLVEGPSGGRFAIYGYMFLPSMFKPNPPSLYVDFYNSSTGQMSALSTAATTATTNLPLTVALAVPASYPDTYAANDTIKKTGSSLDIFSVTNPRVFNRAAGLAMPKPEEIGGIITVSGTTSAYTGTLLVRLWMDTANGRRLVSSVSKAASTAYSFVVGYSDSLLSKQLYKPGGTPPRATCATAKDQRLIEGYQQRVYISSFVPTANASNPFPQFPDIATEDSDGWSFDIAPSPKAQLLVLNGEGDALHIITNETWHGMSDLRPNSLPYFVFGRGALGPQAFCFAEQAGFLASWDGVYWSVGRSRPEELTEGVRRIYQDWLLPDCQVCIGYDGNTRSLLVCQDTRYMRYRFPTSGQPGKWTRGTLSENIRFIVGWHDEGASA